MLSTISPTIVASPRGATSGITSPEGGRVIADTERSPDSSSSIEVESPGETAVPRAVIHAPSQRRIASALAPSRSASFETSTARGPHESSGAKATHLPAFTSRVTRQEPA